MTLRTIDVWLDYDLRYREDESSEARMIAAGIEPFVRSNTVDIFTRINKITGENHLWQRNFQAELNALSEEYVESIREKLSNVEMEQLESLFVAFNEAVANGGNEDTIDALLVASPLAQSIDGLQEAMKLFVKMLPEIHRMSDVDLDVESEKSKKSATAIQDDILKNITHIMGNKGTIRDTGLQELSAKFDDFDELCADLDNEDPPVNLFTDVQLDVALQTKGIESSVVKSFYRATCVVPAWQAASVLADLRKEACFPDPKAPAFIMTAELIYPREKAFRLRVNGNMVDQMLAELDQKVKSDERYVPYVPVKVIEPESAPARTVSLDRRVRAKNRFPKQQPLRKQDDMYQISLFSADGRTKLMLQTKASADIQQLYVEMRDMAAKSARHPLTHLNPL